MSIEGRLLVTMCAWIGAAVVCARSDEPELAVVFALSAALVAVGVLVLVGGRRVHRRAQQAAAVRRADEAALRARCERQDAWWRAGDARGIYGEHPPVDPDAPRVVPEHVPEPSTRVVADDAAIAFYDGNRFVARCFVPKLPPGLGDVDDVADAVDPLGLADVGEPTWYRLGGTEAPRPIDPFA